MYTVYMHIAPNGKKYVGITGQSVNQRWRKGKGYKKQILFYRAINKYGWDNIEHIIVADNLTKDDACNIEQKLICKYNTTNCKYGYNNSIGGSAGPLGVKRSKETIEKLRASHIGKVSANKGKTYKKTKEQCIQQSIRQKGRKPSLYMIQRGIEVNSKEVIELETNRIFISSQYASKITGVPANTIGRHCRNEVKNPKFQFTKKEDLCKQ